MVTSPPFSPTHPSTLESLVWAVGKQWQLSVPGSVRCTPCEGCVVEERLELAAGSHVHIQQEDSLAAASSLGLAPNQGLTAGLQFRKLNLFTSAVGLLIAN